jgi:hypothetical protein
VQMFHSDFVMALPNAAKRPFGQFPWVPSTVPSGPKRTQYHRMPNESTQ